MSNESVNRLSSCLPASSSLILLLIIVLSQGGAHSASAQAYEPHPKFVKPRPVRAWQDFYQPPGPSDLIVTHVTDPSPIIVTWNYDLNQYFGRLVQALAFVRGAPVTCPQSFSLFAGLKRHGVDFNNGKHLTEAQLKQIGQGLQSRAVLTLQLDRDADRKYQGVAIAVNSQTGQSIGRWEMKGTGLSVTPENAFVISDDLARRAAAGLFVQGGDVNQILTPLKPSSPENIESARRKAAEAEEKIVIPAMPRLMEGYGLALDAIELAPEEPSGWNALSLAALRLSLALQGEQLELWYECRQRGLVASRIANWLAPADARILRFRAAFLYHYGRRAAAMDLVKAQLEAAPGDPMWQALDAIFWQREGESLQRLSALQNDPLLLSLVEGLTMNSTQYRDKLTEWIKSTRVAPNLMLLLADRYGDFNELVQERHLHLEGSIQGSALGLLEIARQWERLGRPEEARRVAQSVQKLGAMAVVEDDDAADGGASATLARALESWCLEGGRMAAQMSQGWNTASPVFNFLQLYVEERDKFAAAALDPDDKNHLRAGSHGLGWSAMESVDLAGRHGIMCAAMIMIDIGKLSAPEHARPVGHRIHDLLPEDPYVLNKLRWYYCYPQRIAMLVDLYTKHIYSRFVGYVPAIQMTADFTTKETKQEHDQQVRQLRNLAAYAPFDVNNLIYCYDMYQEIGRFDDMIEVAGKIMACDPAQFQYAIYRMKLQAYKKGQRLSDAEIQAAMARIPDGHVNAPRERANLLIYQKKFAEAITVLEQASAQSPPLDMDYYLTLGFLHRLQGEPEKAMQAYEQYLVAVPAGLAHATMLEFMTWVKIYEGDWTGATAMLKRAQNASGGKASTMELSAAVAAMRGDTAEAQRWCDILENRYPNFNSYMDLGWYYLAQGQLDKAEAYADDKSKRNPFSPSHRWLKVEAAFRRGNAAGVGAAMEQLSNALASQSQNFESWAKYNFRIGNYEWTENMAQQLLDTNLTDKMALALIYLTHAYTESGQLDKARASLDKLTLWASPTELSVMELEARLLLAEDKPKEAWSVIEPAARAGTPSSRCVAAMTLLALGRDSEALRHAEIAVKSSMLPNEEWRFTYAQALEKNGKKSDARKEYESLVKDSGGLTRIGKKAKAALGN